MKNSNPFLGPFAPLFILALPALIYWMGYGAAWYWCKLRGWDLSPEFIELGVATVAAYSIVEAVMSGFKKYARYKTKDIKDEEKRERKEDNIWMLTFAIFVTIIATAGWIALEVMRL